MSRDLQERKKSELTVIIKAKDLCSYVMKITQKSPKHFRFSYVSRLQNLSLDVIEELYRANDTFVTAQNRQYEERRLHLQHQALISLRLLAFVAEMAYQDGCILARQYEQIAMQSKECENYLGAWIASDRKRMGKQA